MTAHTRGLAVNTANLVGVNLTVLDIEREDTPTSLYHDFKWMICVRSDTGRFYHFSLNPSRQRNETLMQLRKDLPAKNMTLEQRTFTDPETGRTVTYHELVNNTAFKGQRKQDVEDDFDPFE